MYIYHLTSGLMLAEVAIKLHESSDCEVPSSFKDFSDAAMQDETSGNIIGASSLLVNSCFLAYGVVHAGSLVSSSLPSLNLDPAVAAGGFAALIAGASFTQSNEGLEKIANAAVMVLFLSFASILLPSLANVHDPMGTVLASGTHPAGFSAAISAAIPLILSSLIYQNIVPSIVKLLNFDRTKSTVAIALGSFLPMAMYMAWCFAVLGGGLDSSIASGAGCIMFTAFSASALVGSCIACTMSLAEEYESIISSFTSTKEDPCPLKDNFSLLAVAMSLVPPTSLAVAVSGGGDFTGALHFAGAFVSPFLYGILPIMLSQNMQSGDDNKSSVPSLDNFPQVLLGAGTFALLAQAVIQDVGSIPNLLG